MKKLASFLIISQILCGVAFAGKTDCIKYVKMGSGNYDFSRLVVAIDKNTGKIIPFSLAKYDNYLYAYSQKAEEIECVDKEAKIFWDIDEWELYANEFSAREILSGYEDGSIREENILTRAEMATILVKLFDIDTSDTSTYFKDVAENEWYTAFITALYNYGVVEKTENFYPNKQVTREDLVYKVYQILEKEGLLEEKEDFDFKDRVDIDEVSDYAKLAYKILYSNGNIAVEDYEVYDTYIGDDELLTKCFLRPQKPVTREETFGFIYKMIANCIANYSPAILKDDAPNVEIPTIDGSTSTYPITQSIYEMYYNNSQNCEEMPKEHSKTTNAYKRLIDNEVEMIFVPDASEEIRKYAEEKNVKLRYIPIAKEALVFFTSKDNKVDNITTEELHDIYVNNSINNWSSLGGEDKGLVAYCRNNDSGSHAQMEKFILAGDNINDDIYKERISMAMASILTDVSSFNEENKNDMAMGYSLYYYFERVQMALGEQYLKLISINGVEPTEENIESGLYPYTTNYYAVVRDEENEKVDKFIELLKGEFGKEVVRNSGIGV